MYDKLNHFQTSERNPSLSESSSIESLSSSLNIVSREASSTAPFEGIPSKFLKEMMGMSRITSTLKTKFNTKNNRKTPIMRD